MWLNDWRLQRFADNLYNYPLPPWTEEVDRHAEVRLMGNGNHCDYVAIRFLATKLSREEVEAYYKNVALPAVSSESEYAQDGHISVGVQFDKSSSPDGRLHFAVVLADMGYPPGFDIRCH
jgi:hypothetical protein